VDPPVTLRRAAAIAEVPREQWDALAGPQPFLRHGFLHALEASGSVAPESGWTPRHLTLWQGNQLAAALPLYEKTDSFGEFVFDWAWAEAYRRNGCAYYPKLVSAVPFTPVPGSRLLARDERARRLLVDHALAYARTSRLSSWHILFASEPEFDLLAPHGLMIRRGVQFHWHNAGYRDFADFLETLTREKRKKIRQERRRVQEAGILLRRIRGPDITPREWEFFFRCYCRTYYDRGRTPYLNLDFFQRLGSAMADHLLLVLAQREARPIAAALDVWDHQRLYGRYWGALEFLPGLHFEACYYQGIEFCIDQGLAVFEGGAQGEHKLARGFEPVRTASAHWLRDARFADAVARFLERESQGVELYIDEMNEHRPFKA
jgi:uncharacterized protein